MFHSPSPRHSQTFPPCARGVRLTLPGCRALGAGLGALPRSPSRRGSRVGLGFLRYKLGVWRRGGGDEERRESGRGRGAPAPLRVPAGQRRLRPGLGVGSPGRRRLRAASLPAALPARWRRRRRRRPRQTMNLRARRAEAGLGPAPLGSVSPRLPRSSVGGVPSPRVLAALRALSEPGTHREGLPSGGAGTRTPPPWLERMQREIGDRGPGDGVVALRTAGGLRRAYAAGHARAGGPEERC